MKQRFTRLAAVLVATLAMVLLAPLPANAQSAFDDYDFTTEDLLLSSGWCENSPVNVSTTWSNPIYEYDPGSNPDPFAELKARFVAGTGYTVSQDGSGRVIITYSSSTNAYLEFNEDSGLRYISLVGSNPSDTFHYVVMDLNSECELNITLWNSDIFEGGGQFLAIENPAPMYHTFKLFLNTFDVEYPLGYQGELVPSTYTATEPKYVALGDSYSSGEGAGSYNVSSGSCHRSWRAYPYYVAQQKSLGEPLFVACSGATTADLFDANPANPGEAAQTSHLSSSTEIVTLTIGGNDAGFAGIMETCLPSPKNVGYGCSTNSEASDVNTRLLALAGLVSTPAPDGRRIYSIEEVLTEIASKAPNADIYIAGYPRLFGSDTSNYTPDVVAPGGYKCTVHHDWPLEGSVSFTDAVWLNSKADELNQIIEDAVLAVQPIRATYVQPASLSGGGHCDTSSLLFHEIYSIGGTYILPESLHPTVNGVIAYGMDFVYTIE